MWRHFGQSHVLVVYVADKTGRFILRGNLWVDLFKLPTVLVVEHVIQHGIIAYVDRDI
jgi:hypothetical protein